MKRIISGIFIILFALVSMACQSPLAPDQGGEGPAKTEEAAEAPVVTDEPTAEPTEEPTPEPSEAPVGIADFCKKLEPGEYTFDLDFNGVDDVITVTDKKTDEWDHTEVKVTVVLNGNADHPYSYKTENCYDWSAWLIDCDPTDSRLDFILSDVYDSDDWECYALRVSPDGESVSKFEHDACLCAETEDEAYSSERGFYFSIRSEILGTRFVDGRAAVNDEGFVFLTDFYFGDPEYNTMELKRDLELTKLDENGNENGSVIVKEGEKLIPVATDRESWVTFELPDGGMAKASVAESEEGWSYLINGVLQDDLFEINYAD